MGLFASSAVLRLRGLSARARSLPRALSSAAESSTTAQIQFALPDPDPAMATTTLPLPGGEQYTGRRAAENARIAAELRRLRMPANGRLHARDVLWCSPDLALVGVGRESTWPGFHAALEADIFETRRVVAVRDVFDREEERATLQDFCGLPVSQDDVLAVTRPVVNQQSYRRLVNEYSRPLGVQDGRFYQMVRNDFAFVSWIHQNGFRLLPVEDRSELAVTCSGDVPVQQSSNHCLMVSPTHFEFNAEAAEDNYFMHSTPADDMGVLAIRSKVLREFAGLHARLTDRNGVGAVVHCFTAESYHSTPDALFPNNTFSTHPATETNDKSATIVIYPMKNPSRRRERRPEVIDRLKSFGRYANVIDLSSHESSQVAPAYLEGTGSLVLDRRNRIAYVANSERADTALAKQWARIMGYDLVTFNTSDSNGRAIYHTNVMLAVGTRAAIICAESISDPVERDRVMDSLKSTGHEVVNISLDQVNRFCGNVLEMETYAGEQAFVMSSGAHESFTKDQLAALEHASSEKTGLVHAPIPMIERIGGGGVRCAIAELF